MRPANKQGMGIYSLPKTCYGKTRIKNRLQILREYISKIVKSIGLKIPLLGSTPIRRHNAEKLKTITCRIMNMMPANLSYGDLPEVLIGFRRYLQSLPTSAAVTTELGLAEDLMKLSGEPTILGHIFKSLCQVGQDEALQAYNEIVNKAVETTAVHKIQREQIQVIIGKLAEEKKKSSKDTPPAGTSIPNTKYNIPRHSLFTYTGPGLDIQKWFQFGENAGKSYLDLVEDNVSIHRDIEYRLVPHFESGKQVPLNKLKPSEALLIIYQLGGYL